MSDVSMRVCRRAQRDRLISKEVYNLLAPTGLSNIELFISLIENNKIKSEATIRGLTKLVKEEILMILTKSRLKKFYLHKSLLELHEKIKEREELIGIISINYDRVIDEAYKTIFGMKPNYCLSSKSKDKTADIPLLKLHGGFDLSYRKHKLPIITPGINKNYLELPYNFIWGRALELLIECDILRVIGCSLSQNDVGLVDLLFKAHLVKKKPIDIELINFDPEWNKVKEYFGFLPRITTMLNLDNRLIGDVSVKNPDRGANPFKIWIKAKIERLSVGRELTDDIVSKTKYLNKVLE